jgi:N-acetyl-anhydromuramyl-L-alanine amidase AmpD
MRGWVSLFVVVAAVIAIAASDENARAERGGVQAAALADLGPPAGAESTVASAPRAASTARGTTAIRFPYVPETQWLATQTNYWEGREGPVEYIVIHYTDISYARTLRAFNIRASGVSAHYVIRGDGHIAQIVGEADTAWHAGNFWFNHRSIGIELELDRVTNPAFTAQQYYAAAALSCAIAGRHSIPLDRAHLVGHNEIPGSDHTDPGPTWAWPHFMWLTSLCAPPTVATVRASFVSMTPYPELTASDAATVSIVLRNTGTTAWRKGTPQEARLGTPNNTSDLAFLGDGWPAPNRPAVQTEDLVPPGGTATFSFAVRSPLPGSFVLGLRPVIDGAAWMDDLGLFTVITVR